MAEPDGPKPGVESLVDSLTVGFAIADPSEWRIEYANGAFEDWFPKPSGNDLLAERLAGLNAGRARRRIEKGRTYTLETELKSGSRATVLRTNLREVDLDGRRVLLAETVNITKQKEQE